PEELDLRTFGRRLGGVLEDRAEAGRAAADRLVDLLAFELVSERGDVQREISIEQRRLEAHLDVLDGLGIDDDRAARGILAGAGLESLRRRAVQERASVPARPPLDAEGRREILEGARHGSPFGRRDQDRPEAASRDDERRIRGRALLVVVTAAD